MDGMRLKSSRNRYKKIPNAKLKNRLNNEVIIGDIINEEDIEGTRYFVVRTLRGNVVKLTKDAYTLQKS